MTTHTIEPTPGMLHGCFDAALPAVLTIRSGDRIRTRTLDASWAPLDPAPTNMDAYLSQARVARPGPGHDGHCLVGPIAVEGAEPGMTLEVRLHRLRPAGWGWTAVGGWDSPLMRALSMVHEPRSRMFWTLDRNRRRAVNQHGDAAMLRPFLGVVGLAPAAPGPHSTIPPRRVGGNIDCRELIEGARLFLPVEVRGAMLSLGDGHAAQGDGEVAGTAIECPMEDVEVEVLLHGEQSIRWPRAETPAGKLVLAVSDDLNEATLEALDELLAWMQDELGLDRPRVVSLASLAVDLRVTQVANGVCGVHAIWVPGRVEPA